LAIDLFPLGTDLFPLTSVLFPYKLRLFPYKLRLFPFNCCLFSYTQFFPQNTPKRSAWGQISFVFASLLMTRIYIKLCGYSASFWFILPV